MDEIVAFAGDSGKHETIRVAFHDSGVTQSLKSRVPGKKFLILDVELEIGTILPISMEQKHLMGLIYKKRWWSVSNKLPHIWTWYTYKLEMLQMCPMMMLHLM